MKARSDEQEDNDQARLFDELWWWSLAGKRTDGFIYKKAAELTCNDMFSQSKVRRIREKIIKHPSIETKNLSVATGKININGNIHLSQMNHYKIDQQWWVDWAKRFAGRNTSRLDESGSSKKLQDRQFQEPPEMEAPLTDITQPPPTAVGEAPEPIVEPEPDIPIPATTKSKKPKALLTGCEYKPDELVYKRLEKMGVPRKFIDGYAYENFAEYYRDKQRASWANTFVDSVVRSWNKMGGMWREGKLSFSSKNSASEEFETVKAMKQRSSTYQRPENCRVPDDIYKSLGPGLPEKKGRRGRHV